jgi:hypothetical protein
MRNRGECPDIEVLASWIEGARAAEEDQALREHVAQCRRCAREAAAAIAFIEEDCGQLVAPEAVSSTVRSARRGLERQVSRARRDGKRRLFVAAAAGVLVAGTLFWTWEADWTWQPLKQATSSEDVPRGASIEMAVAVSSTSEGWRLRWDPVPGAVSYRVLLLNGLRQQVAESTQSPEFWIPREKEDGLRILSVVIEVVGGHGEEIGASLEIPILSGHAEDQE